MLFQTSLDKIKRWLLQGHLRHYRTPSSALPDTLTIAGISIRQDAQGRLCLNDLHKAAGNLPKDQPAKYFAIQQAKDLISEIGEHSVHTVRGYGKEQGTYVCKELVYAYAMWISPKFHLQVIRAYDELVTKKQKPQAVPTTFLEAMGAGIAG